MDRSNLDDSLSQVLGDAYLGRQSTEARRENGRIYTPPALVDFILESAGFAGPAVAQSIIVDPACGSGAFLEAALDRMAHYLFSSGQDLRGRQGGRELLCMMNAGLWGIDVDHDACALAREVVARRFESLTGGRLPESFLQRNIIQSDFLLERGYEASFPFSTPGRLLIVGNPPYVSAERLGRAQKDRLLCRFESAFGRLDLYGLFIERAIELTSAGSKIAFVTPDKFLTTESARELRKLIVSKAAVRTVARFSSHRLFARAAVVPSVIVLERSATVAAVSVLHCESDAKKVRVVNHEHVSHPMGGGQPWQFELEAAQALANRLRASHAVLDSVCERISAGPATGRDGVFVVPSGESDIEPELLKAVVRGRNIRPYVVEQTAERLLVPYVWERDGTPKPIALARFAGARRYLKRHRDILAARHCVRTWGKSWHEFHDAPVCDFAGPKIVVPDIAQENRFAIDVDGRFPLHSAYYLVPRADVDLDYLVAVLNSSVSSALVRIHAPRVKDGFSRYRRQFLAALPIPAAAPAKRRAIAAAARNGDFIRADELVTALFGLADKERQYLRRFL